MNLNFSVLKNIFFVFCQIRSNNYIIVLLIYILVLHNISQPMGRDLILDAISFEHATKKFKC